MTFISGDKRADGRSLGFIVLHNSDLNLIKKYYFIKNMYIYIIKPIIIHSLSKTITVFDYLTTIIIHTNLFNCNS